MTSTQYQKLQRLLMELFRTDQADLDFGIYRVINQKRDEINATAISPDGRIWVVWKWIRPLLFECRIALDKRRHISRNLGLTDRRTASWAAAEEITAALRELDPLDPVKYDFALCHLGVSRECPSRRDPIKCARCVLKDVCSVWSSERRGSAKKAR